MTARYFLRDQSGAASAEMALLVPMLVILMFGGMEAGHFLWTEHKVIEAVRNGVRYAARQNINDICPNSAANYNATVTKVALLTRTGQLASPTANPVVPGWSNDNQVNVTFACGGYMTTGIYTTYASAGPTVTVAVNNLNYPSLFGALGVLDTTMRLDAKASTAVIGI